MKKIITLFIIVLSVSFNSLAQISKGAILLGGDISAYTEKQVNNNVENKISGIAFSPVFGKAIKKNLVLGGNLSFASTDNEGINGTLNSKEHFYGLGMFLRKYQAVSKNFYVFIQGGARAGYSKTKFDNDAYYKVTSVSFDATPGISYKISKKLHLEFGFRDIVSLGYTHQKSKGSNSGNLIESNSNRYYLSSSLNNFNSSLYFGFRLLLDKS